MHPEFFRAVSLALAHHHKHHMLSHLVQQVQVASQGFDLFKFLHSPAFFWVAIVVLLICLPAMLRRKPRTS